MEHSDKLVVIDKTTYSIVELPGTETQVVVAERNKLLGHIDLRSLVQDLGNVGRCIQLAYHGMVAAGPDPECVKLQLDVQRLGYDVTRLCDKSAVTVSKFKSASTTILTDLQATYGYLLSGFENMALKTLSSVSDLAGRMAKAAEDLHDSFDEQAHKVERVLENTRKTEAGKELTARQREVDRTNLEKQIERGNELLKKAQEKEEEAEQSYRECELKEDKAIQDLGDEGLFQKLANGLTSKYLGFTFGQSKETKEKQYKAIKEKKVEALKMKMERERERLQAFQKITDLTVELQGCKDEAQFAKSSAKALHKAMEGLKILAALMMKAALFWQQMQEHCKLLSDSKLKDEVKAAMDEYSGEMRLKLWTSEPFKTQAVRFYAGWVALDCVCGEYMGAIKETQKELYKYIQENPTQEEAEKNVPSLAAKFQQDLQDAQKACAERDSEMQEEIRMLMEN